MSKHDSFRNLFSPTTAPLPMVFKRPTSAGPSLAPWAKKRKGPNLLLLLSATLIEAPHPQEVNYLAGKEAPSSVLINYLWRCNYSEYGISKSKEIHW